MEDLVEQMSVMAIVGELNDHEFCMVLSLLTAGCSRDPCTQVGACIVDREGTIIGTGFNQMPRGCDDVFPWGKHSEDPLENKYFYVCHAELNAICNTPMSVAGCRMYVTLFPCNECAKLIIQFGITEVVYKSDKHAHKKSTIASKRMFDKAGVQYWPLESNQRLVIDLVIEK